MRISRYQLYLLPILILALLPACERGTSASGSPVAQAPVVTVEQPAAVALEDVVETRPEYIVGISFPKSAAKYPVLAQALKSYAETAQGDLMRAVAGLQGKKPSAPYDLSLSFTGLVETPDVVAVAADGSSYTGGAHGNPLVARFTWLPKTREILSVNALFPAPAALELISDASREQLATAIAQRLDAGDLEGAERAEQMQDGAQMLDVGTAPNHQNFDQFEPVMDVSGRIRALRFVFPPAQVGPYVEGTRTVDIPAQILLPIIAPEYKALFIGG